MKTTPEFTDAEIQDMMDFKQVLALTETAHRRTKKIVRGIMTTVLITGLIGGAMFVYDRYSSLEQSTPSQPTATDVPPATIPPTVVPLDTTQQVASPNRMEASGNKSSQKPLTGKKEKLAEKKKDEKTSAIQVDSARSLSVFLPAEPIDGYPALYDYFAKELLYPEQAIKDSIQGVISVTFIISAQGKPERVSTDHSLGEAFDQEAIRLIENMPAWKPAQLDGTPVRSKLSVPITFTLKTVRQP